MAISLSDVLTAVQNGVTAANNLIVQVKGSFNNIAGQLAAIVATVAANTAAIAAIVASYVVSLNGKTGAISLSVTKQVFTANGTYTPTTGMIYCVIEAVGGGGGGGAAVGTAGDVFSGGGGGAGSYSLLVASAATIGSSQTVSIGALGSGGTAGTNNGAAGGDTSVGTLCIAKGGGGGMYGAAAQVPGPGLGGVTGTGDLTARGMPGMPGFYSLIATVFIATGMGGSSYFGGGAAVPTIANTTATAGIAAGNYGSGGSGAVAGNITANAAGGDGSKGLVIITEYVIA